MKKVNYFLRHQLILFTRDSKIKLLRYISNILRRILIPEPEGELIVRTVYGYSLHVNPRIDKGVERDLYYYGTYERGILEFMDAFLKNGDMFIDIGANIGLMSIHASYAVGKEGKVYSFEANPETAVILNKNLSLNGISNVDVQQYALGASRSTGRIYSNWHINRGGASLIQPSVDSNSFEIEINRFDEVMRTKSIPSIKLVKIDVEGFELEVLKGFGEILTRDNAPALIVECSDRGSSSVTPEELYRYIVKANGYRIFKLKRGKEVISELEEVQNEAQLPVHDNIICLTEKHLNNIPAHLLK
jgi:FkbM family methyltransferase